MIGLERRIDEAKRGLELPLDEDALERLRRGTIQRAKSRARRRVLGRGVLLGAMGLGLLASMVSNDREVQVGALVQPTSAFRGETEVRVRRDGQIEVIGDARRITSHEGSPGVVQIELRTGAAWFDVEPDASRRVEVQAGFAIVTVLGTSFRVDRRPDAVWVEVAHGEVELRCRGETMRLRPPERRECRDEPTSPELEATPSDRARPSDVTRDDSVRPRSKKKAESGRASGDWRELAAEGDFDAAYRILESAGTSGVLDHPEELLRAADVARLSGHPGRAIEPLERVLSHHARDPRAPLAAFTLGRLQLDELGNPRAAAEAFARARGLRSDGPLAQDALAREVEARSRAGEDHVARRLAEEYLRLHPNGTRIRSVRRFGGLE